MAKKPAIIATIAATPPFVTKEVAADEGVDEAAELAAELAAEEVAGTEAADAVLEALGVIEAALEPEVVRVPLEAPDDSATPLLGPALPELAGVENGIELGVALGPVGVRLAISGGRDQKPSTKNNGKNIDTRRTCCCLCS